MAISQNDSARNIWQDYTCYQTHRSYAFIPSALTSIGAVPYFLGRLSIKDLTGAVSKATVVLSLQTKDTLTHRVSLVLQKYMDKNIS